jgi:hypothetical protein
MGVDQPECGAGRASPAKWSNTNTGKNKTSQTFDRQAVGCNLMVLKRAPPQSHCKIQAPFPATPCEQFKVLSALVQRCDARVILF